ncbi:MAG: hypothetical protein QM485_11555 [Flavobacteriaceae bacterium]
MKDYLLIALFTASISAFLIAVYIIVSPMFLDKEKTVKEKVYSLIKNKD